MNDKRQDDGVTIFHFADHFLVRCPKCDAQANVRKTDSKPWLPRNARFTCSKCPLVEDGSLMGWSDRDPVDWVFHYPLWLQANCRGNVLWAYNPAHLDFLESYVTAKHRTGLRSKDGERRLRLNSTLASRMPAWIGSAKNRELVLKTITRLRQTIVG